MAPCSTTGSCTPALPPRKVFPLGTIDGPPQYVGYRHRVVAKPCGSNHVSYFEGVTSTSGDPEPLDNLAHRRALAELQHRPALGGWTLTFEANPSSDTRRFDEVLGSRQTPIDLARAEAERSRAAGYLAQARAMRDAYRPATFRRHGENGTLHDDRARNLAHQHAHEADLGALLDRAEQALSAAVGHHTGWSGVFRYPDRYGGTTASVLANQLTLWSWEPRQRSSRDVIGNRLEALTEIHRLLGEPNKPWDPVSP